MGLADGNERHALGRPVHRPCRRRDPFPDGGEIGRDNPFHSSSIPGKDRSMLVVYYRPSAALAASLSLALAACVASPSAEQRAEGQPGVAETQKSASSEPEVSDTEATIWTVLGLAKKQSVKDPG